MKEINEAYDMIMNERAGKTDRTGGGYGGANGSGYGQENGLYQQVRAAINAGNIGMAEMLLSRCTTQDAEWYYLMGTVYYRKGWYDEARRFYSQACQMSPGNPEYQKGLDMVNMSGGYGGYRPMDSQSYCDCCTSLLCLNCCLNCCGGGC
jgi:hypothetical protein